MNDHSNKSIARKLNSQESTVAIKMTFNTRMHLTRNYTFFLVKIDLVAEVSCKKVKVWFSLQLLIRIGIMIPYHYNSSKLAYSILRTSREIFREENHTFCIVVGQQNEKGENKSIRMPTGRALILESKAYKVSSFHHCCNVLGRRCSRKTSLT